MAKTVSARKKKPKNRDAAIFVRLTPDEHTHVKEKALSKGLGISAWVRMVLIEHLQNGPQK